MNNELKVETIEKKTKKGNGLLIGILALFVGLIIGSVITGVVYNTYAPKDSSNDTITKENLDKEDKQQNDKNENKEQPADETETKEPNTSLNLTGEYEYEYKDAEYDTVETRSLYLYDNGNFWYDICESMCYGYAGNYQIKNDEIILNEIISFGSDAEAYVSSSEKIVEVLIGTSKLELKEENTTISFSKNDNKINNKDFYEKLNRRILNTDASESEFA